MIIEPTVNSILNFWLQKLFNSATVGANTVSVLRLLTAGFLLWMVKRIAVYGMLILRERSVCNMKADLKKRMFEKLMSVNMSNLSQNTSSGEHISMFTNDIVLIEQRYLNQILGLISGILSIAIMGYSFVALNAKLAFSIIGFGFLTMLIPALFSKSLNTKNLIYTKKIAVFTQKLKEYFTAYPTIKNYSVEDEITERFNIENSVAEDSKFEAECAFALANSIGQLVAWFMQFIGVGLGIILVIRGEILIGTVIAAQAFAGDLALPIQNIIININAIRSVKNIVKKLEGVADTYKSNEEINLKNNLLDVSSGCTPYDIEFRSLSLKVNELYIIKDFSFRFEHGKKYLMIGVNGAGKSSVFKVLKKWYKSCSGNIMINKIPISYYSNESLSNIVSYLNENVSVFSGSLKDNITLFRNYSEEEINVAIKKAGIDINLSKNILDDGGNISSGEKRRIEIARSLLQSAPILIYDEVVSTLDIETAFEIEQAALKIPDKTVIFISHNFSGKLLKEYDSILIMDDGKLVASGNYEELIRNSSYFKKICDIKFGYIGG